MKNKNKIVLFYGMDPLDGKIRNGQIDRIGNIDEGVPHISCFKEFCNNNFLDIPAFQRLTSRSSINAVGYILSTIMKHVVFLNTTIDVERYGYNGIFFMPPEITEEQILAIKTFASEIKDFNIKISYDLVLDAGFLDSEIKSTTDEVDAEMLLDHYFNETSKKIRK